MKAKSRGRPLSIRGRSDDLKHSMAGQPERCHAQ